MAKEIQGNTYSFPAASDLSTHQFKMVVVNTAGRIELSGAGAAVDGVLLDKPNAAGKHGDVQVDGIAKIVCGSAIAVGDLVASDASGVLDTAATTEYILGRALTATAAAGELCSVLITRPGRLA
jgi:hypothetical protein